MSIFQRINASLGYTLGAVILGFIVFFLLTLPQKSKFASLYDLNFNLKNGAYVFNAAMCSGCHMAPKSSAKLELSGGQAFETAYGVFFAPNISTSTLHGIGSWSLKDFANAVKNGVSPDSVHYYPAFPYTAYVRMSDQDLVDLWAFWQTLPAIEKPNQTHQLKFPFSLRALIGGWKAMFLTPDWVTSTLPGRGRYLVEALGHCGECHTPRFSVGGLKTAQWFEGGPNPSGQGMIPNVMTSTADWSEQELAHYFASGFTPNFDVVGGKMATVVEATAELTFQDQISIAAYIKALQAESH